MKLRDNEIKFIELLKEKGFRDGQDKLDKILAKNIANAIESMVNSFCFNGKNVIKAIDKEGINDNFQTLAIAYIKALGRAYHTNTICMYDGRNEASCKISSMIMNCAIFNCNYSGYTNYDGFNKYIDDMDVRKWEYEHDDLLDIAGLIAIELTTSMHRTLQQTFAGMCFLYLSQNCKDLNEEMKILTGLDEWYRVPFI